MDFQTILEYRNSHNPFCQKLGIRIEEIRAGYARVVKQVTAEDQNPLGYAHGGLYFTMADTACGSAVATHGRAAVTMNASYQFLRSAKAGSRIIAEATEIKAGAVIAVYDVRLTDQDGTLLGTGTFTFFMKDTPVSR